MTERPVGEAPEPRFATYLTDAEVEQRAEDAVQEDRARRAAPPEPPRPEHDTPIFDENGLPNSKRFSRVAAPGGLPLDVERLDVALGPWDGNFVKIHRAELPAILARLSPSSGESEPRLYFEGDRTPRVDMTAIADRASSGESGSPRWEVWARSLAPLIHDGLIDTAQARQIEDKAFYLARLLDEHLPHE